jgi:hypothetical protein
MARPDHQGLADALRRRVLEESAETSPALRQAVAASAAGGPAAPLDYEPVARRIGESPCRVTDPLVASTVAAVGSEKAAFELIIAAAVGAGLLRWEKAVKAMSSGRSVEGRDASA